MLEPRDLLRPWISSLFVLALLGCARLGAAQGERPLAIQLREVVERGGELFAHPRDGSELRLGPPQRFHVVGIRADEDRRARPATVLVLEQNRECILWTGSLVGGRIAVVCAREVVHVLEVEGALNGEVPLRTDARPVDLEGTALAPLLRLVGPFDLRGRVVDGGSGEPVAGAEIALAARVSSEEPRQPARTDARGRFRLRLERADEDRVLEVAVRGRTRAWLWPRRDADTEDTAVEIALPPTASVRGRVLEGGRASSAQVRAVVSGRDLAPPGDPCRFAASATTVVADTDPDGRFEVRDLPAGVPVWISVYALADGRVRPLCRARVGPVGAVILEPGEARALSLELEPLRRVEGRAFAEDGTPLADAGLWLGEREPHAAWFEEPRSSEPYPDDVVFTRTDAQGRFVFEGIPCGDWVVGPGARPRVERPFPRLLEVPVVAREADARDVDRERGGAASGSGADERALAVDLRLGDGATVTGRVVDESGAPLPGQRLALLSTEHQRWAPVETRSVVDGAFAFRGVPTGRHRLIALSSRVPAERIIVAPPREAVVVRLVPAPSLRVSADVGQVGTGLVRLHEREHVAILRGQRLEPTGSEIGGVEPGSYDVAVTTPDGRVGLRTIELTAGVELDLHVPLELAARLVLHVSPGAREALGWWGAVRRAGAIVWCGPLFSSAAVTVLVPPGPATVELYDPEDRVGPVETRALVGEAGVEQRVLLRR